MKASYNLTLAIPAIALIARRGSLGSLGQRRSAVNPAKHLLFEGLLVSSISLGLR
jgi:hypothetical protein